MGSHEPRTIAPHEYPAGEDRNPNQTRPSRRPSTVVRPQEDALTGISLRELEELSKTRFSRAAQRPKGRARGGSICGSVRSLAILVRAELTHSQKNLSIKKLDLYESLPGRFVMRSKVWRDSPDGN
jgi:hypothetical protein